MFYINQLGSPAFFNAAYNLHPSTTWVSSEKGSFIKSNQNNTMSKKMARTAIVDV